VKRVFLIALLSGIVLEAQNISAGLAGLVRDAQGWPFATL
jgi:uncharacterized membrane protein